MTPSHPTALQTLLRDWLSPNRGPGYRITLLRHSDDFSALHAEFRFLPDRRYCCTEPGCHLPENTARLLELAATRSIPLSPDVRVHWHFIVEQGAELDPPTRNGQPVRVEQTHAYDATTPPTA